MKKGIAVFILAVALLFVFSGCEKKADIKVGGDANENSKENDLVTRESAIPEDVVKITPEMDANPPRLLSDEYEEPVPVAGINTAGGEDSSFIMPDGNTIYFFFTPDVRVPAEMQVLDGVTGIYASRKVDGKWEEPERVVVQDKGKLALDGCEFVLGNRMWFCSAREDYTGIHWFTAELENGAWKGWENADFNPRYNVGELHIFNDELYFHSDRDGGKGGLDIWVSRKVNGEWGEPENVEEVNTNGNEGWPALNPAGDELWISRNYGLWRSKRIDGRWSEPEMIISPLAGEASIDSNGNVYFTHHFYRNDTMLEADIYVARKK